MGEFFCTWCRRRRFINDKSIGTSFFTGPECVVCKEVVMDDSFLTKQQVAELIHAHGKTVERAVKAGRLPAPTYQLGPRSPRWSKAEVIRVMTGIDKEVEDNE